MAGAMEIEMRRLQRRCSWKKRIQNAQETDGFVTPVCHPRREKFGLFLSK
jgi:hypothetical protein